MNSGIIILWREKTQTQNLQTAESRTAIKVLKFIKLAGSIRNNLFKPPRPAGSTKVKVPTPLKQQRIVRIIATIIIVISKVISIFTEKTTFTMSNHKL